MILVYRIFISLLRKAEEKENKNEYNHKTSESNVDEEMSEIEPTPIHITITVKSIENLDFCKINEISLKMEYMDEVIAQSEKIEVKSSKVDIDLSGYIMCDDINPTFMDDLLSNPVLFRVSEVSTYDLNKSPTPASQEIGSRMKGAKNKFNIESKVKLHLYEGICNLDIGGFLNGKKSIRETLFLEPEKKVPANELVSWVKLPKLKVVASLEEGEEFDVGCLDILDNFLGVTVESIYHIPHQFSEASHFEANIPFPRYKNKKNILAFSSGKIISVKDDNNKKKWANLFHNDGPGNESKYSLSDEEVISPFTYPINLKKIMKEHEKKVQWNMWKTCALSKEDCDLLYSKMMKYRIWPVEIFCETRKSAMGKASKGNGQESKKTKSLMNSTPAVHFIAFLNISSLLYPGVRKARVAGHLHAFSQSEVIKKLDEDFFSSFSAAPVGEVINKSKSAVDKHKNSANEIEEKKDEDGKPLFNEQGLPAFIVVEFELFKPFIPKRKLESLEEQLQTYVSLKEKTDMTSITYEAVKKDFSSSIKDVIVVMSKEYENFAEEQNALTTESEKSSNDFIKFYEFLRTRENFTRITTTLENKVLAYVNEKHGKLLDDNVNLPGIYVDLVEEMHEITNNNIMGCYNFDNFYSNKEEMQLYVEEAIEENDFIIAKTYLLLKIRTDKNNPNYWLDYAIFCFIKNDLPTALEASKEALSLDMHHQMGLLIYGVISATLKDITAAELAFQLLLTKYSDFIEAWTVLQLLYLSVGNSEAADVAMQASLKLDNQERKKDEKQFYTNVTKDNQFNHEKYNISQNFSKTEYGVVSFKHGMSWSEPLSWTTQLCLKNKINFRVAILLLKLGFIEYAATALSEELMMPDGNIMCPHYQYYLAVISYLQGSYENAICHLNLAVKEQGKNCFLWSLMGHCYYKMNDFVNAIECYEFVLDSFNRPDDIHLIYMRMGNYYLKAKKFYCAKKMFATACKYSPSPRVWKGVGIACLRLGELDEAEVAFSEANYLDNRDADTWGYLALVNGLLGRKEILRHCFLESKKITFMDQKLYEEVLALMLACFGLDW